ncbi:MAG: redoxin family protein [Pseudomonadota bacterium]
MQGSRRLLAVLTLALLPTILAAQSPPDAPPFTQRSQAAWLNSEPLTMAELRGRVLLVDFWTFGCWNCYRSFPWLLSLEQRLADEAFTVISVHSPEFEHEHDIGKVREQAAKFGLTHPIMIDNDFAYWQAMNNRYWPTYYLIDAEGRIRDTFIGETHAGQKQALAIEAKLIALLNEAKKDEN